MPVPNVNFVDSQQLLVQQYQSSKKKEIQQLSDHTHLRSDLAKLLNAGKRSQMKPPLFESVSQDYISFCLGAFNFSFRHSDTSIFFPLITMY